MVADPEALDGLFEPPREGAERTTGRVVFEHANYEVTAEADGNVDRRELS